MRPAITHLLTTIKRPDTMAQFRLLQAAQHWEPSRIRAFQEKLLGDLLRYAQLHSSYYRDHIRLNSQTPATLDFLKTIQPLQKETVKEFFSSMLSDEIETLNARENRSGGSTGLPTRHMQDEHFRRMDMANNLLFKSWANTRSGEKSLFIAADERDYFGQPQGLKNRLIKFAFNKSYFNAFKLSEDAFRNIADIINRDKPAYIQLYTSIAYEFARYVVKHGIKLYPPKMVMCIAGSTPDDMLDMIERAFLCPILSRYGSRETGDMAGMCRYRHYHEMSFTHVLEVLDDHGQPAQPGEIGHIAVTVLTNRALPLIRYKIGDMGLWADEPCLCGVRFRALKKIAGRTGDLFKNSRGKIVLPEIFIHLIGVALGDVSDDLMRYQVIQKDFFNMDVKLVTKTSDHSILKPKLDSLASSIKKVMEEDVDVNFLFVDEIPKLASGKYSYTRSKIPQ